MTHDILAILGGARVSTTTRRSVNPDGSFGPSEVVTVSTGSDVLASVLSDLEARPRAHWPIASLTAVLDYRHKVDLAVARHHLHSSEAFLAPLASLEQGVIQRWLAEAEEWLSQPAPGGPWCCACSPACAVHQPPFGSSDHVQCSCGRGSGWFPHHHRPGDIRGVPVPPQLQ